MAQGQIKKLVRDRGFGFILPEGGGEEGKDLFFHRVDVEGNLYDGLQEGQTVNYEVGTDERRGTPKATRVAAA
ncbi:MAG: cold shock domain-containing protein [Chloroflexi bacterium]|nr:cold shock domain-containing protein [Chloroflexota bacterium]